MDQPSINYEQTAQDSSQQYFQQLYLIKYKILKTQYENNPSDSPNSKSINSNGIVSIYTLPFIFVLICVSIAGLFQSNQTFWPHVKALKSYFTITILEQDNLSIYDMGDNVDEAAIELVQFQEIQNHFIRLCDFVGNFSQAGFVQFFPMANDTTSGNNNQNIYKQPRQDQPTNVTIHRYLINSTVILQTMTFEQFSTFFKSEVELRSYLLPLRLFKIEIPFGHTKMIDDFTLIMDYQIFSHAMIKVNLSTTWNQKSVANRQIRPVWVLRYMEQLCAAVLLVMYCLQVKRKLSNPNHDHTDKEQEELRKNNLYWCTSLIFLNLVTISSSTLAPICSVLQLLPIFETHDSSNTLTYNFNVNLRYAAPLVFSAFLQIYILVNGFIFYSMIMYPSDYFDDYITSFFSYFYNNYQYGIYEIFTELKGEGNFAYFLYIILYFYMVLVGSNLVPALFCTLIYRKIAERELLRFVELKLEQIVCPVCLQENYQKDTFQVQVNINTPKSPYIKSGTMIKTPKQAKNQHKVAKIFIEEEKADNITSPILSLKSKHKKARELLNNLEEYIEIGYKNRASKDWLTKKLEKVQQTMQRVDELQKKWTKKSNK